MSVKVKDVLDALQQMQKSLECSICLEMLKDPHSTKCNHQFCGQCIKQVLERSSKKSKNKWYCPLCKTPVSKRSLTPNPKLKEIISAVRNLQGAVQDDTGVPIGSPPSQPLKSCLNGGNPGSGHLSIFNSPSQKCASDGRDNQSVSRNNQLQVSIDDDDDDNADKAMENHHSRFMTNDNKRTSLRSSTVTPTTVKNTKTKKAINTKSTKVTRNSRKPAQKKDRMEENSKRSATDELLRMIDTMSFQPVSENGPACPAGDFILVPNTSESNPDPKSKSNHVCCTPMKNTSAVHERDFNNEGIAHSAYERERSTSLTTIAEADSSVRAGPAAASFDNKNTGCCEVIGSNQDNEGVVSSTKCDSGPQSSEATLQSVSILPSLDCYERAPGEICDVSKEGAVLQGENKISQAVQSNKLVSAESNVVDTHDEPRGAVFDGVAVKSQEKVYQKNEVTTGQVKGANIVNSTEKPTCVTESQIRQCHAVPDDFFCQITDGDNRLSTEDSGSQGDGNSKFIPDVICDSENGKEVRSEKFSKSQKSSLPPEEMMNFEVTSSDIRDVTEQSLDFDGLVSIFHVSSLDRSGRSQVSVQTVGTMDSSDLCERVKQRQRRRATEMALKTNPHSGSPKSTVVWKTKAKKRSADSANEFETTSRPGSQGSAKKKLKTAKTVSPSTTISVDSNEGHKTSPDETAKGCDEIGPDCYSSSRDKTQLSNEVVPPSVSSSNTCQSISPLINPMIAYIIQTSHSQTSSDTKAKGGGATPELEEGSFGDVSNCSTSMDDYPVNLVIAEGIDRIGIGGNAGPESPQNEPEATSNLATSQTYSSCQNSFSYATDSQGSTAERFILKREEQMRAQAEGAEVRESLTRESISICRESHLFDPSEKALSSCNKSAQTNENVNVDDQFDCKETQGKWKQLFNFSNGNISDGKENNQNQTKVKSSDQAAEADQEAQQYSSNSPTQSCLDSLEMDAVTPCLFGNDSWETPDEKTRNQRRCRKDYTVDSLKSKSKEEKNASDEAADEPHSKGMSTLNGMQDNSADHCRFSGEELLSADKTPDPDDEETQSFATSQSISVLQDLEVPSQEQQTNSNCGLEDLSRHCGSAENPKAETSCGKNSFAEPLPKKSRNELHSALQKEYWTVSPELQRGPFTEKPSNSEHTESEVIPPTPPVKPVLNQVFGSLALSPSALKESKESRTKLKLQRTAKEIKTRHDNTALKQKNRVHDFHGPKSPRLQNNKDDSEPREKSVSSLNVNLANDVSTIAEGPSDALTTVNGRDFPPVQNWLEPSQDSSATTTSDFSPSQLPKTKLLKSRHESKAVESGKYDLDGSLLSQRDINSQHLRKESQIVALSGDRKNEDGGPPSTGSANSTNCNPFKQRDGDIGDSFDWSGTRDTQKDHEELQAAPERVSDDKNYNLTGTEDSVCGGALLSSLKAKGHKLPQELKDSDKTEAEDTRFNEDDCVIVGDNGGDYWNGDNEDDEEFDKEEEDDDDDAKDSSDDEALLRPVFLPKQSKSQTKEESSVDDVQDNEEEEEAAAFSQELIPSENDDEDDDEISSSCKALDSTGASSATLLSEAAASTQKMEVLRQDVEAMEKEMEELRAYLAKTDENREEANVTNENDGMDCEEDDQCVESDVQPSLTPPPPLTPTSIPPMRQLSTPLKDVSRYLEEGGQLSDEESGCEEAKLDEPVKRWVTARHVPCEKSAKKRPLSPSFKDDGLSITAVERRQEETPSPPRSDLSVHNSQEKDEDKLIVLDDRDSNDSRTGSLLLVKRRKIASDLMPRKSPVVSLLFTKTGKNSEKGSQSPQPLAQSRGSSPVVKRSSPFIYSGRRSSCISPIRAQSPPRPEALNRVSRASVSYERESLENVTGKFESRDVSRGRMSRKRVSLDQCQSPDLVITKVKDVINTKFVSEKEDRTTSGTKATKHVSFVATRLNRQQLADARALAESCGGKLASEFNSKTSHVVMATDENMHVTRHSYTMKYLLGLALGKWIVSHHWITACKKAKTLVAEENYEVKGDTGLGQSSIPRKARIARANKEALLFHEFDVLCFGGFGAAVTKEQLSQLLKFCGARVCSSVESLKRTEKGRRKAIIIDKETRDDVGEIKAVCRQLSTKPVSLEWVTDSLANYKIQDLRDYLLEL